MDLYQDDGWVNASLLVHSPAPFVIAVGGRGIGKTYGVFKELLSMGEPFIYLRRSQVQMDACKVQELSPFAAVARDVDMVIESKALSKYVAGFYDVTYEQPKCVAIGVALSTFSNIRGFDASEYDYLVFDEFIPEKHERPIPHEGDAFLNVLETINRNRELQGRGPIKVIMLSNANKLDSPLLQAIGSLQPLDRMVRRGQSWCRFYNGDLEIFRYMDSPISEKKKNTALYRLSNSEDFSRMSLDNAFSADTYYNVCSKPLGEYRPIASTQGITVFRHKSRREYYVTQGTKSENVYNSTPEQQREFCRKTVSAYDALCRGEVYFASAPAKVIFENIWR